MRRLCIVLALLHGGCAASGMEPTGLEQPIQTGALAAPVDAGERAHGEIRKAQHLAVEEARRPLRAFLAEKGQDCNSQKLREAKSKATDTAVAFAAAMRPDYAAMLEASETLLEVADAAKRKGCVRMARDLYDFVLARYKGFAYAAARDRATAGLRELKSKGAADGSAAPG